MYELLKLNAYGGRWHVLKNNRIIATFKTKRSALAYFRRHNVKQEKLK